MSEQQTDDQGRPEPSGTADATGTLLEFLEYQRATLEWKCRGLSDEQLRAHLAPTTMTLAGLLAHMTTVEDHWFSTVVADQPFPAEHYPAGFAHDDWDWEWTTATELPGDELRQRWRAACERSRGVVEQVLPDGGLGRLATQRGEQLNLAWVLTHMIEEYARHNGHADLLRESIDGETGE